MDAALYIVEQRLHEVRKNLDTFWETMGNASDNVSSVTVEKDFDPLIQAIEQCTIPLKKRRNAILPIHRLPDELLSFIVRLTSPPLWLWETSVNPHLSYTWVCHHWRWVLTHDPVLWSSMAFGDESPSRQRLRRELFYLSKSSELSILVKIISKILEDTFVTEGHRIRNLYICIASPTVNWPSRSNISFPSLRSLQLDIPEHSSIDFFDLLPILEASNNLENLRCAFWDRPNAPFHLLAFIFSRIRRLYIQVYSISIKFRQSLLESLRACVKLQGLRIDGNLEGQVIVLPELRMLDIPHPKFTNYIRAPKLSHLDCKSTPGLLDIFHLELNINIFDFALIRYLYIKIDTKQPICCISGSGSKEPGAYQCADWDGLDDDEDMEVFPEVLPRNYFHFEVCRYWPPPAPPRLLQPSQPMESLLPLLSRILPRLTNLTELHLVIPYDMAELEDILNVIKHAPLNPIDKVMVNELV